MNEKPRRSWLLLAIVIAASFAVRIAAWAYWQTGTIESEGAEYARIAENLRNGVGYVGMAHPGTQLNFNPLFPILIAAFSFVTHNYEWAGRVVALIMGALLPLPVFGIASRLFNRRVGFVAAALTALHPLLVQLSFSVYSEGPYATLFLCSVYLVVRALERPSTTLWTLVGTAIGLSYLLRAEATALLAIAISFALLATPGDFKVRLGRTAAAVATFVLLALPVVVFLYHSTGKARLEGKSALFAYTGQRILAAQTAPGADYRSPGGQHEVPSSEANVESGQPWEFKWAFYGIDSHLKGMGFPMRPNAEVIRETEVTLKDVVRLLAKGARQSGQVVFERLASGWLGAPLLPALALLGAARRPWRGRRTSGRMFLLVVAAAPIAATCFALWNEVRYSFVFVPLLSIWAANGLYEVGLWTKTSAAAAGWRLVAHPALSRLLVPALLGVAMTVSPLNGVRRQYVFSDSNLSHRVDKEVGVWIGRQQSRPVRIMDVSIPLAYHAGAEFSYFPYCDGGLALRYLDAVQVDYVVLRRGEQFTKYYDEWLAHGIPDRRAELVELPPLAGVGKFVVFRWRRDKRADSSGPVAMQSENEGLGHGHR